MFSLFISQYQSMKSTDVKTNLHKITTRGYRQTTRGETI